MNPLPNDCPAAEILAAVRASGSSPLGPARPRGGEWRARLDSLPDDELLGDSVIRDANMARCVRSGLLLFGDDLDASHTVSQSIPTAEGSYWHGIMHRREPDYSNAKYWFRRVGPHPIFDDLSSAAAGLKGVQTLFDAGALARDAWDPFRFVDAVAASERDRVGGDAAREGLVALQEREMLLLLEYCYRMSV